MSFEVTAAKARLPTLLPHGVLPHAERRAIFVSAMKDVVLPGLQQHGVPMGPAREWLEHQGMI